MKYTEKVRGYVMWAPIMRFNMELALEGVISAIINIVSYKEVQEWNYGEVLTIIVSGFLIMSNLLLIPILATMLLKNLKNLNELEETFGEFIENQKS